MDTPRCTTKPVLDATQPRHCTVFHILLSDSCIYVKKKKKKQTNNKKKTRKKREREREKKEICIILSTHPPPFSWHSRLSCTPRDVGRGDGGGTARRRCRVSHPRAAVPRVFGPLAQFCPALPLPCLEWLGWAQVWLGTAASGGEGTVPLCFLLWFTFWGVAAGEGSAGGV